MSSRYGCHFFTGSRSIEIPYVFWRYASTELFPDPILPSTVITAMIAVAVYGGAVYGCDVIK
jgi:hypothetical protein